MKRFSSRVLCLTTVFILLACSVSFAEGTLFDETFEFSYMYPTHSTYTADNMFDAYMDEYLNTKINWIQVSSADFENKLSTTLSSGDLPDVIRVDAKKVANLVDQGAIIALDDLMDAYGENIAARYDKWNGWKNVINPADGHIYGVYLIEAIECANAIAIRQDWLDALDLPMPVTLDEWVSTLYAFKEAGLGGEVTYPVGNVINAFFDAFGVDYTKDYRYVVSDDGSELINRYECEHYIEALELLNQLYADEIINPYIYTQSGTDLDQMVYAGYIGMVDTTGDKLGNYYNVEMEKTIEGAWFTPSAPILGPYGDQSVRGRAGISNSCATITTQAKDPEKIMQYFNWLFSDEGSIIYNFGIEGETFDYIDGKPVLRKEWANFSKSLWPNGICCNYKSGFEWRNDLFVQVTLAGLHEDELNKYQQCAYDTYTKINEGYYHGNYAQFTTETEAEIGSELWQKLQNAEQKAITGEITIEEFKNVLAQVKADGLDTIISEANEIWAKLNA